MNKTTTIKKQINDAIYSHPVAQRDANVLSMFNELKTHFKLKEAFRIKGHLYEFYDFFTETTSFYIILVDSKPVWHTGSRIYAPAIEKWRELTETKSAGYFNGTPFYEFVNGAKEVEAVKLQDSYLEFNRIRPNTKPGSGLKNDFVQIPGTNFQIGRSIMYRNIYDKPHFFYSDHYSIRKYDVEYNLSNNKRFNTRFYYIQLEAKTKGEATKKLLQFLQKEHTKAIEGYWGNYYNPETDTAWVSPNSIEADKYAQQIESVKQFQGAV